MDEVNTYLAQADEGERERVLAAEAEREGGGRVTVNGLTDHLASQATEADEDPEGGKHRADAEGAPKDTTTESATFAKAAAAATPAAKGYLGTSPERERTGLDDKGLSQQNRAIMEGGAVPDSRQGVDDSEALEA